MNPTGNQGMGNRVTTTTQPSMGRQAFGLGQAKPVTPNPKALQAKALRTSLKPLQGVGAQGKGMGMINRKQGLVDDSSTQ